MTRVVNHTTQPRFAPGLDGVVNHPPRKHRLRVAPSTCRHAPHGTPPGEKLPAVAGRHVGR